LKMQEPFAMTTAVSLGADQRTRVMLFATNVDPSMASSLSATAVSAQGVTYQLPIEYVGKVPNVDTTITQIVVILPQDSTLHGDVSVTLTLAGSQSNKVVFAIR
jgi:uncharacterized protein (TIGR03437 family)